MKKLKINVLQKIFYTSVLLVKKKKNNYGIEIKLKMNFLYIKNHWF